MTELVFQPSRDSGDTLAKLLEAELTRDRLYDRFVAVVAFAQRPGIERLRPAIEKFTKAGGRVQFFVGVDFQRTSSDALEALINLDAESFVVYDPSTVFHPKLYFLDGPKRSYLLLGSSNLTGGGLETNCEANVCLRLSVKREKDVTLKSKIAQFIASLEGSKALNSALLDKLVQAGLLTEAQQRSLDKENNWSKRVAEIIATVEGRMTRDTMIQDVDPLNASIYFDDHMYVGSRQMLERPTYFAPYFSKPCVRSPETPNLAEYGISRYSPVLMWDTIKLVDLKALHEDEKGVSERIAQLIARHKPNVSHAEEWKRGFLRIIKRAVVEKDKTGNPRWKESNQPIRLYYLDTPVPLGGVIEKRPKNRADARIANGKGSITQITRGFGTSFARLAKAKFVEDLTIR